MESFALPTRFVDLFFEKALIKALSYIQKNEKVWKYGYLKFNEYFLFLVEKARVNIIYLFARMFVA